MKLLKPIVLGVRSVSAGAKHPLWAVQCAKQNWPCSGGTCAGAGLWPAMCWGRPQACQLVPEQAPSLPTCAGAGPRPANLIVPGQATAAPLQPPLKTINIFFMLGCQPH